MKSWIGGIIVALLLVYLRALGAEPRTCARGRNTDRRHRPPPPFSDAIVVVEGSGGSKPWALRGQVKYPPNGNRGSASADARSSLA